MPAHARVPQTPPFLNGLFFKPQDRKQMNREKILSSKKEIRPHKIPNGYYCKLFKKWTFVINLHTCFLTYSINNINYRCASTKINIDSIYNLSSYGFNFCTNHVWLLYPK